MNLNLLSPQINNTNNRFTYTSKPSFNMKNYNLQMKPTLQNDLFVKSSNVKFKGYRYSNTSNGKFLKELENITDPYSGIKLLTANEMKKISKDLSGITNISSRVKYLSQYENYMHPIERNIYKMLITESKKNKFTNITSIFHKEKINSTNNLRKEQNVIFDKIAELAENIKPENKKKIDDELLEAKDLILIDGAEKHHFKRKAFINRLVTHQQNEIIDTIEKNIKNSSDSENSLNELKNVKNKLATRDAEANIYKAPLNEMVLLQKRFAPETLNNKNDFEDIIEVAKKLPTSNNSTNAFIVKYQDRSPNEIAERLLIPSVGTIEHIKADSLGGENEAANFMLASKQRNEERGNMSIKEYIKMYPGILKYTQKYMNDIIKSGNQGKLEGHEWYPYLFKDSWEEATGQVLDISKYNIEPKKAFKTIPNCIKNKYPKYKEYMK